MDGERQQNSQQDRRVYVGNLSYDVKWHHLKDHMREGMAKRLSSRVSFCDNLTNTILSWQRPLRRRSRIAKWNEQG